MKSLFKLPAGKSWGKKKIKDGEVKAPAAAPPPAPAAPVAIRVRGIPTGAAGGAAGAALGNQRKRSEKKGGKTHEINVPQYSQKRPGQGAIKDASRKRKRPEHDSQTYTPCSSSGRISHPFDSDYCDHFETPLQAYRDVEPILAALCRQLGKKKTQLRCWDPYYCAGSTKDLLKTCGYPCVHNVNEDFYNVIAEGREPPYDVIITNPPYSADHKERCFSYLASTGRPFLVLMPNYIANKQYVRAVGDAIGYVAPVEKYEFAHPEGTGHETSPFFSIWFICLRERRGAVSAGSQLLRTYGQLTAAGLIPCAKRGNPRQRKAAKKKHTGS